MPIPLRRPVAFATAIFTLFCLHAGSAGAFRIISSSSGAAGVAGAPCCDTGFDGGFESSTIPYTFDPGPPPSTSPVVLTTGGSNSFDVPLVSGGKATVSLASQSRASLFDIGTQASVEILNWDASLTGGSIEAFSSARLEQVFTPTSSADLWLRPVFQIDGSISHAAGFVSSITFNMRGALTPGALPTDNILLDIDGGVPGTTAPLDLQLIGPEISLAAGGSLFLSLQLTTQVSGSVNNIPDGDHFGEVDAYNTLTLIGFETYSDAGLTTPVNVDFESDSGETFSTIPEPGTALLVALGLGALGLRRRR